MMRVSERRGRGLGQWRSGDYYDQYSATAERLDEDRPSLFPTDTTPMDEVVEKPNPGEKILREEGEILPLTPVGARSVLVYPQVVPAPDITQDMDYEDVYPRDQHRTILRGSQGVSPWGPYGAPGNRITQGYYHHPYLKIGKQLGQYDDDNTPVTFLRRPDEIAYQTYPGPFLGQEGGDKSFLTRILPHLLTVGVGAGVALLLLSGKPTLVKHVFATVGLVAGGVGLAGAVREVTA